MTAPGDGAGGGRTLPVEDETTAPFWEATTQELLLLQWCAACGLPQWPPRAWCPRDASHELAWAQASGRGTVYSFSVVHRSARPYPPTPYVLAIVLLDEGVAMTTNIVDVDPEAVAVEMPVEVRWEPLGNGRRLPVFGPASGAR